VTKHVNYSDHLKITSTNTQNPYLKENRVEENTRPIEHDNDIGRNEKRCPACKNGHEPTGKCACYVCQKFVHVWMNVLC